MKKRLILPALVLGSLMAQEPFSEWTIPTPNSQPHCVVSDSRGRIWYAAMGANQVGVFDPATQEFREVRTPTLNSRPHGIAVDSDDTIWFTEQAGNKIGKVTTSGTFTEYSVPTASSQPEGITAGPDGNLWFTEFNKNKDRKSTRLNSSHIQKSRMPSSA